jgi:hypothetical protein
MIIKIYLEVWMKFEERKRIWRDFEYKLHIRRWKGIVIATPFHLPVSNLYSKSLYILLPSANFVHTYKYILIIIL